MPVHQHAEENCNTPTGEKQKQVGQSWMGRCLDNILLAHKWNGLAMILVTMPDMLLLG